MELDDILNKVSGYQSRYVTVTGGEPLAQKPCLVLLKKLCDQEYKVSLETSGALDISPVDERVVKVMDLKTPGSGEIQRNLYQNLQYLTAQDQIKFVICDRDDYEWAKQQIEKYNLNAKCEILFSPSYGQMDPASLAQWILHDHLAVHFQLQLHKQLWGEEPGR